MSIVEPPPPVPPEPVPPPPPPPPKPTRNQWLGIAAATAAIGAAAGVGGTLLVEGDNGGTTDLSASVPEPIVVQGDRWTCSGPQHNTVVIVQNPVQKDGKPWPAGVNLGDGCTGTIGAIIVMGNQRDGIKVGGTARDLEILSGWIACGPRAGVVHQDGVQAGGGTHVHFHNLHVDCPQSNNSSFFINQTNGGSGIMPTDITCTDCDLLSGNNALNIGPDSLDSGARYSILRKGTGSSAPENCYRSQGKQPVVEANVCIDPSPAVDTGRPVNAGQPVTTSPPVTTGP